MPSTNDVVQIFTAQHGVYDRFVNYVRYPQGLRSFFEQSSLLRSDLSVLDAGCGTGRYEEAEDLYRAAGKRDERPQQLLGFLYRQAVVRNRASAQPAYEEALLAQFPQGPATRGDDVRQAPDRVSISTPRPRSAARWTPCGRHHCGPRGMAGKVEQYMSINAFFAKPEMKIAVWRGTLLNVETVMPGRLFGVDLKSYPLQGWIER
jgi:hypothetical protein